MFRQVLDGCWFAWLVRVHRVWTGWRQTRKILVGGMTAGSGRVGMAVGRGGIAAGTGGAEDGKTGKIDGCLCSSHEC